MLWSYIATLLLLFVWYLSLCTNINCNISDCNLLILKWQNNRICSTKLSGAAYLKFQQRKRRAWAEWIKNVRISIWIWIIRLLQSFWIAFYEPKLEQVVYERLFNRFRMQMKISNKVYLIMLFKMGYNDCKIMLKTLAFNNIFILLLLLTFIAALKLVGYGFGYNAERPEVIAEFTSQLQYT